MALVTTKFDDKCKEVFDEITHGSCSLSFDQFIEALTENEVNLSHTALQSQWNIIDTDGSDDMDLAEFKVLMQRHFEASDAKVILQKAFNSIYINLFPNDPSDLLTYKTQTRRVSHKNVVTPISRHTLKQKKDFEKQMDQKISDIFKLIDVDASGTLELNEMWEAVELLGIPISYDDLKLTYDFFDTDQNGCIEEPEFKRWMSSQITKYWADESGNNQFVAFQRAITSPESVQVLSTRASKAPTMFSFTEAIEEQQDEEKTGEFEEATMEDVRLWDVDKTGDFVSYLFKDKQYDDCRDKYVAIFMANMINGKKFMGLSRRQVSHLGVMTKKGQRHVSVIRSAQRQIELRTKNNSN